MLCDGGGESLHALENVKEGALWISIQVGRNDVVSFRFYEDDW